MYTMQSVTKPFEKRRAREMTTFEGTQKKEQDVSSIEAVFVDYC
jgi:hypothetical protein